MKLVSLTTFFDFIYTYIYICVLLLLLLSTVTILKLSQQCSCVNVYLLHVCVHEQAFKHNGPNYSIEERSSGIYFFVIIIFKRGVGEFHIFV